MEQLDQVKQVHLSNVPCTHGYKEHWIYGTVDQVQQVHLETTVLCTHGYKEHWIYMEQFDQVQQVHLRPLFHVPMDIRNIGYMEQFDQVQQFI